MDRFLVIDQDRAAMQRLGLTCLEKGVGVAMAETLCEGVRALLSTPVSLIAVDAAQLRLTAREHATLFERVAPGVPVVVVLSADAPLDARVAYELGGFRVLSRPVAVEDLVEKAAAPAVGLGR
jgi:DNA-binding response OmpR family regulator